MNQTGEFKAPTGNEKASPTATLTVEPAGADGKQRHREAGDDGREGESVSTLQFRPDGPHILSLELAGGPSGTITCTFDPPLPAPPYPTAVGKTVSGKASCSGSTTIEVAGSITGTRDHPLDGKTYTVYVIEAIVTIKGQISASGTQLDWYSPDLRLSVHTESRQKGTFAGFPFESETIQDLVSGIPA